MQAIVYVVDVTDSDRIAVARDEMQALLDQPRVKDSRLPILLFANKVDLSNMDEEGSGDPKNKNKSLSLDNVRVAFGVDSLALNHKVKCLSSSGLTGSGIAEGFSWLSEAVRTTEKGSRRRS